MKKVFTICLVIIVTLAMNATACTQTSTPITKVIVLLSTGTEGFGETSRWEAALYQGAQIGQEIENRFTEWKSLENSGAIEFFLPNDILENTKAPWDLPKDTYIRVRTIASDSFPVLDIVSSPFTLLKDNVSQVTLRLESYLVVMVDKDRYEEAAKLLTVLATGTNGFGDPGPWEASVYQGAGPSQEIQGRFTEWKMVDASGGVEFYLPEEVLKNQETPWEYPMDTYFRIRTIGEKVFPRLDIVCQPFTLAKGQLHIVLATIKTEFSGE